MHQLVLSSHLVDYFIHRKGYSEEEVANVLSASKTRVNNILAQKTPLTNDEVEILVKESNLSFLAFIFTAVPEKDLPEKLKILKKLYKHVGSK
tara:strand:- start:1491 stop:1769 length:279 start_codon:yes stop_codon:yes gene_type:complete